ncbi:MAG: GtrA family protein [Eubacterium sp.]|nr:GtrA family protein [Candidatus Colimonas fimequi]
MKKIVDEKTFKFIIVGICNTIVGTGLMFLLYNLAGCSYWVSSAANYIVGSILSYVLNSRFTFNYKGNNARSISRFVINIAGCWIIAYGMAKPACAYVLAAASVSIQENVAMCVGMVLFVGLNYIGQRYFVFAGESGR